MEMDDPKNIFTPLPVPCAHEIMDELLARESVRIERIVSRGHTAPAEGWYDQEEDEWVLVLEGVGRLGFEDGTEVRLERGDYIAIPAHCKHRVTWTDPDRTTIWLAIHYNRMN